MAAGAALLALLPSPAFAYRPFRTEDAGVAGRRVVQLETSWDGSALDGEGQRPLGLLVPIYGLTRRIEVSAEIPWIEVRGPAGEPERGIGDISLVGKLALLHQDARRAGIAAKAVLKTSTGDFDRGLGSGGRDASLFLVASAAFGRVTAHTHVGHTRAGGGRDPSSRDVWRYSAGLDARVAGAWNLIGEVSGNSHPLDPRLSHVREWRLGTIWRAAPRVHLDASVARSFHGGSGDYTLALGASWTI